MAEDRTFEVHVIGKDGEIAIVFPVETADDATDLLLELRSKGLSVDILDSYYANIDDTQRDGGMEALVCLV